MDGKWVRLAGTRSRSSQDHQSRSGGGRIPCRLSTRRVWHFLLDRYKGLLVRTIDPILLLIYRWRGLGTGELTLTATSITDTEVRDIKLASHRDCWHGHSPMEAIQTQQSAGRTHRHPIYERRDPKTRLSRRTETCIYPSACVGEPLSVQSWQRSYLSDAHYKLSSDSSLRG